MVRLLSCFLLLSQLCSCGLFPKPSTPAPLAEFISYHTHTVKLDGETLGAIALWYTGKVDNWKLLTRHNPKIRITSILIGDRIKIPSSILITQKPLPKSVIDRLALKSFKNSNSAVAASEPGAGGNSLEAVPSTIELRPAPVKDGFHYQVTQISGCENFGNSLEALDRCAALLDQEVESLPGSGREL